MVSKLIEELSENDRLVKIFWTDATGELRVKKGKMIQADRGSFNSEQGITTILYSTMQ